MAITVKNLECDYCNNTSDLKIVNGDTYCEDCFNEKFFYCNDCNELEYIEDAREDPRGNLVCQDCFDNKYFVCERCDEVHSHDNSYSAPNGSELCSECFHDNYMFCDICDSVNYNDDMTYSESREAYVCDSCYDENESNYIKNWHYHKGSSYTHHRLNNEKNKRNLMLFGIEVEAENAGSNSHEYIIETLLNEIPSNYNNYLFFENDGSLSNGFETITHPCSYNFLHQKENFVKTTFEILQSEGMRAYKDTCGQHIHVNKRAYKTVEQYKLLRFFILNNDAIMSNISQRKRTNYCSSVFMDKNESKKICKNKYTTSRNAIYFSNNTIEFRLFQGNLTYNRLLKNIEFIQELKIYLSQVKLKNMENVTFYMFLDYLKHNLNSSNRQLTNFLHITNEFNNQTDEAKQCV